MKHVLYQLRWWLAGMVVMAAASGVWLHFAPEVHAFEVAIFKNLKT